MPEDHRHKIQVANILNRMGKVAMGEVEATPVQVQAAFGLLRKAMPDLAQVEHKDTTVRPVAIVSGVERGRAPAAPPSSPPLPHQHEGKLTH